MNIKELLKQSGICESITNKGVWLAHTKELERFAELVRQDERDKCAQDYLQDCCNAIDAARLEKREACAKVADNYSDTYHWYGLCKRAAEAIRARVEHEDAPPP